MNRLVLIGNGFDLALGIKTGYVDFLAWLIKKHIVLASREGSKTVNGNFYGGHSENRLFSISFGNPHYSSKEVIEEKVSFGEVMEFIRFHKIDLKQKSSLFKHIFSNAGKWGWVDIEEKYYTLLKECLSPGGLTIAQLNEDLSFLCKELQQYLIEITNDHLYSVEQWEQMKNQFNAPIEKDKISHTNKGYLGQPEKFFFLNFNYTSSVEEFERFFRPRSNSTVQTINIHGQLNNPDNPMIFGFGDEIDEHYRAIEKKNNNGYFQHIKSFGYFTTPFYHDTLRFLEEDNFQVFIYGHSCGLSDRTLLKEIFEHENCKSIKVFYYQDEQGNDDFKNKTMELSRHFESKGEMRKKIMSKQFCESIPQLNREMEPIPQ